MNLGKYGFIILTLIIIIIIAIVSKDLSSTVLILALTVNFIGLYSQIEKVHLKFSKYDEEMTDPEPTFEDGGSKHEVGDPPTSIYNDYEYDKWNEERQKYDQQEIANAQISKMADVTDVPVIGGGVDAAAVRMSQFRAREKAAIKGARNKTSGYYKYHFANELDETEKRPWWGQYDT